MSEKKKPKVIILESNIEVSNQAKYVLEKEGWDVTCETVSKDALATLAQSTKTLFALFISNFKLPKMEGDDILLRVKSISPLTQRMLIVPDDKPESLIKAINKAEIHACIISPFKDENLINQAKNCFRQFKHALKQAQLKRVTSHQNKQMYNIAKKLKKKSTVYQKRIDEKKAQTIMLKSQKRKAELQARLDTDVSLETLMEYKKIVAEPALFLTEFSSLCNGIKTLFDQITDQYETAPIQMDLENILKDMPLKKTAESEETTARTSEDTDQKIPAQNPGTAPSFQTLVDHILKMTMAGAAKAQKRNAGEKDPPPETTDNVLDHELDEFFEISISQDQTKAWLKRIKPHDKNSPVPSVEDLLDLLLQKEISYGILDNETIITWMSKSNEKSLLISKGEVPIQGKNGSIKFYFQNDFTNPGKINEDGTIDFRERGDIPYVRKGDLLAEKTFAQQGKSGISISGIPIPVEDAFDPVFGAGSGGKLSEDGTQIHADIDGQPHCDALGIISVSPDLVIPGDVDYETGNIDFKGNILIKGMIKEGFTVKGINVVVQEIEGGTVDISGDLSVSAGITDSNISVHGNTMVKFINNSKVMAFGNVTVSKEIIDSDIILSGVCINSGGHIISSRICAKMGIEAGNIGTNASRPVKLKVGVEEHLQILNKQIDENLEASVSKAALLKDEIKKLEDQDQMLYEQISEKAYVQDRAQVEIKQIKQALPKIENSNDLTKLHQASNRIKQLKDTALNAEQELNTIFKSQDKIANSIETLKSQIKRLEGKNKAFVIEKQALKEFSIKNLAKASLTVAKTITQDSTIKGAKASLILKESKSRCKILELGSEVNGMMIYEMQITDL